MRTGDSGGELARTGDHDPGDLAAALRARRTSIEWPLQRMHRPRVPVAIEGLELRIEAVSVTAPSSDIDDVLAAFVELVRRVRIAGPMRMAFRRTDIDALAEAFQWPGEDVVAHLAGVIGANEIATHVMGQLYDMGTPTIDSGITDDRADATC